METTLRMFYARALGFVLFVLVLLFAMAMLAAPAFAQDAPAVPETDFIDLIFSSAAAAAMSIGATLLAVIGPHVPAWLRIVFEYFATRDAKDWEPLVTSALDRAEAYVRSIGADALKDRNGWINSMVFALYTFNPEIVKYFDKNNNGVIDMLEGYIAPQGVNSGLVALIATRLPPGAVATPSRKTATTATDALASALTRRAVRAKEAAH